MLKLTRRIGETVFIGDDISVTVVEIRSGRVKLDFKAPFEMLILRGELRDELREHDSREQPWRAASGREQLGG